MSSVDLVGLGSLLAIGLALAWLLVTAQTAWRLTHPVRRGDAARIARRLQADPGELSPPAACDSWTTLAGGCPVWEIAGDDAAGPVVVFCHGWGRSRHDALDRFPAVRRSVSRLIALDLPGHGGSSSPRSTLGAADHAPVEEIVRSLARAHATPARSVVLWGWSLGAGVALRAAVAAEAAAAVPIAGVIFESGYRRAETPARNVLIEASLPHRFTLGPALAATGLLQGHGWRGFDRAALAARLRAPLLVLHGEGDRVSPVDEAREIAEAAPGGVLDVVRGAGHRDLWGDAFAGASGERVRAFLGLLSSGSARGEGLDDA
ncbi:MAG: alpha/beta fold hydrolase [Planctomycetota bacterium]